MNKSNINTGFTWMILLSGILCATVRAQEPDYSNVNDILSGKRLLLRDDDFVAISRDDNGALKLKTFQTKNGKINQTLDGSTLPITDYSNDSPFIRSGRVFNVNQDSLIVAGTTGGTLGFSAYTNGVAGSALQQDIVTFGIDSGAIADFNGDGYADAVVSLLTGNDALDPSHSFEIVTAVDVNDSSKGLRSGPLLVGNTPNQVSLAVGDFNGDGRPEIAVLTIVQQSIELNIFAVDPKTLTLSQASHLTLVDNSTPGLWAIAAGQFTSAAHKQLAVAYALRTGAKYDTIQIDTIDFDSGSLQPNIKQRFDTQDGPGSNPSSPQMIIKTGQFNWSNPYDQIAFLSYAGGDDGLISVFQVNPNDLTLKRSSSWWGIPGVVDVQDMLIGNFDHQQTNPTPPPVTLRDPNLQISLLYGKNGGSQYIAVLDVDSQSFEIKYDNASFNIGQPQDGDPSGVGLAVADTQGRSLVLGEPTKIVLDGATQPTAIIAAPPMHIDFSPLAGQPNTSPAVINVSAAPKGFFTEYDTDQKSSNQSTQQNTNSWAFGAKETVSASVGFGIPDLGSTSVSDTFSAAQNLKGQTEQAHGVSSSKSFDISSKTGFSDQVWFTQSRFNVYVYPVIGQLVCPAAQPNCPDSEKVPLTIQFSAPDQTSFNSLSGNALEWYQPVWEPGNVLSYPASYSQLQGIVPNIQKLSTDLTWSTDGSSLVEKSTWANNASSSQSTSFNQNYSFDNKTSVTASASVAGFNASASFSLDLSGSYGLSSLNQSSSTLGNSTGIAVTKPGLSNYLNYQYPVTPYIFGQSKPGNVTDNVPLSGDIKTFGLLQTAFVADPQASTAGGWWSQTYTAALDVALNHPARWALSSNNGGSASSSNCLSISDPVVVQCATLAPSYPNDPWLSEYHWMRGFFISNANSGGQGPQLETATAGDKLLLQARVYNYSFQSMPAGASVHARFYVQPWNAENNTPSGNSVLIGEDTSIGQIPPFSDNEGAPPNWVLASTTFDTTPYSKQHVTFWVLVWMQDANGNLVKEIAGHGLSAIPSALKSLADVPLEYQGQLSYSNNVGFYKSAFYVFGPTETPGALLTAQESGPEINIGKVQLSARSTMPGQPIQIAAVLSTGERGLSGTTAMFYDGDPHAGGQPFDVERASYIPSNSRYQMKVPYRTDTCGTHDLFVVLNGGTAKEIVRRAPPVRVDCDGSLTGTMEPTAFGLVLRARMTQSNQEK